MYERQWVGVPEYAQTDTRPVVHSDDAEPRKFRPKKYRPKVKKNVTPRDARVLGTSTTLGKMLRSIR
jgi:hypothetical protein